MDEGLTRFMPAFLDGAVARDETRRAHCEHVRSLWSNEDEWPGDPT